MQADMKSRIAPPDTTASTKFSDASVNDSTRSAKGTDVQFLDLLRNSNETIKAERNAKKSGDLSSAKNDKELFQMLNDKNEARRVPKNSLDKDDFLKMFVTQLQNQDPLNPKDGTEMAAQLAQFNGLEQMLNVNKNLEKMQTSLAQSHMTELSNYIGKDVVLEGGSVQLKGGKLPETVYELPTGAGVGKYTVRDGSGNEVAEGALPNLKPGQHSIKWDGKLKDGKVAPDGTYTFEVNASDQEGRPIEVKLQNKAQVSGIDISGGEPKLITPIGKIDPSRVVELTLSKAVAGAKTQDVPLESKVDQSAASPTVSGKVVKMGDEVPVVDLTDSPASLSGGSAPQATGKETLKIPEMPESASVSKDRTDLDNGQKDGNGYADRRNLH
jgi:flagellar hook assembly protein FlgD